MTNSQVSPFQEYRLFWRLQAPQRVGLCQQGQRDGGQHHVAAQKDYYQYVTFRSLMVRQMYKWESCLIIV
jgi:hypothetical protein